MKFNELRCNFLQSFPNQRANLRSIVPFPATESQFAQLTSYKIGRFNNKASLYRAGSDGKIVIFNLVKSICNSDKLSRYNETDICLKPVSIFAGLWPPFTLYTTSCCFCCRYVFVTLFFTARVSSNRPSSMKISVYQQMESEQRVS